MNEKHILNIADEHKLNIARARSVSQLLEDGATVPFIARYRKEATGSLDEVVITQIRDGLARLAELDSRREAVLKSLEQNGHLTDELREKVMAASTLAVLEDIYLPFRPKRRTKATIAREKSLAPPLGAKRVMGIDPGFRTGCKIVCLDRQGKLFFHDTIYPHFSEKGAEEAVIKLKDLCERFDVEAIAVGNGTAGRETEAFVKCTGFAEKIPVIMVNESGASIYSASETARE